MSIWKKILIIVLLLPSQFAKPDIEFDELDYLPDSIDTTVTRDPFTSIDCYNWLINVAKTNELLAENFYNDTYFLNSRPIYTLPIFLNFHNDQLYQDRTFNIDLFYNETPKMRFTENSPFISSYINIGPDDGFMPIFRDKLKLLTEQFGIDIPETVGLFTGAKVQERRLGLMLQFLKSYKNITFEVVTPLMYQEHNYFFTDQEQKNIRDQLGEGSQKETEDVVRSHFVSDRLGFGDTRMKLSYQFSEKPKFCGRIGLELIIPTAFSFKNGLYGSHFRKNCMARPSLSLCEIVTLALDDTQKDDIAAAELAKDFGLNAIDWLSAILLDSPLGGNKHFAIGFFFEPSFKIADSIKLDSLISLDYIIPKQEQRFFLNTKNPALFAESNFPDLDPDDPDDIPIATKLVNFLNQQALNTFFPLQYNSMVKPGLMFQFTIGPRVTIREWSFQLGYDFWLRNKEIINPIFCIPEEGIVPSSAPRCYQSKLFGSLKFNKIRETHDWAFSVNAEQAFANSGIGKDFCVSLGFQINF